MSDLNYNIDKLFRDRLRGHRVEAPGDAWSRLQTSLNKPKKTRFFWYPKAIAATVALLIAFSAGYYFNQSNRQDGNQLVETLPIENVISVSPAEKEISGDETPASEYPSKFEKQQNNQFAEAKQLSAEVKNKPCQPKETNIQPDVLQDNLPVSTDNENVVVEDFPEEKVSSAIRIISENSDVALVNDGDQNVKDDNISETQAKAQAPPPTDIAPVMSQEMLHELLINNTGFTSVLTDESGKKNSSNWSIGARISPVYSYRSIEGSTFTTPDEAVGTDFFNDNEQGITSMAGGISLDYKFNNRVSFASGMYLSRIGQQNNDVLAYNDPTSTNMYKLTTSTGTVTINPANFEKVIFEQPHSAKDTIPGDFSVNGSFYQNLDYLEVPLVLKYKVVNKKLSINLMGGLSPGILVNNHSFFDIDGQKLQTGTVENINPFIYNSILGFGFDYAISNKLSINMEPSFKYSLSPVNSAGGLKYHPYSLSWFTGISYKLY